MEIVNSTQNDLGEIFELYDKAIAFQKTKFHKQWQGFDRELVQKEIEEKHQWKIMEGGKIACIFATTFSDPFIWGEKNDDPAVYIHRIVTNPDFRGNNFVKAIANWARTFCLNNGKKFIRMDTWGDNQRLIDYYQECGFQFLGIITPSSSSNLPKHYNSITLSLFEIKI